MIRRHRYRLLELALARRQPRFAAPSRPLVTFLSRSYKCGLRWRRIRDSPRSASSDLSRPCPAQARSRADLPAAALQGVTQETSFAALVASAMPLPCPVYRKRKPTILGERMAPKFTHAYPGLRAQGQVPASTLKVTTEIQVPVPSTSSQAALCAGSVWVSDLPPFNEQYWKVTASR
jgi:hypothetical protein